jgi:hypothetical protein
MLLVPKRVRLLFLHHFSVKLIGVLLLMRLGTLYLFLPRDHASVADV